MNGLDAHQAGIVAPFVLGNTHAIAEQMLRRYSFRKHHIGLEGGGEGGIFL